MEERVFNLQLTKEEILILQELTEDEIECLEIPPWKAPFYGRLRKKARDVYDKPSMPLDELEQLAGQEWGRCTSQGFSKDITMETVSGMVDKVRFYKEIHPFKGSWDIVCGISRKEDEDEKEE